VFDGEIDCRLGGGDDAVHRPAAGRARSGHVEEQLIALLGDLHADGERLVDHAVAVDLRGTFVDAVGNAGDLGPHLALSAVAHLGDGRAHDIGAIAVDQCSEAHLASGQCGGLGLDVADALVGNADVGQDDGENLLVHLALLEELHRRQAQPLLLDLGGAGGEAAGHHAADVGPVAGVGEPGEDLALVEERLYEPHVHQMGAAEVGVVDDEDVARLHHSCIVAFHPLDDGTGRELHGADEDRQAEFALGDQGPVSRVINAVGAVHALGNHRRERRPDESQVHFVTDLDQAVLDDSERDGIEVGHA